MKRPTHGFTHRGHAVHAKTTDHLPSGTRVDRINSAIAVKVSVAVGSMWCAYIFCLLALASLPAVLSGFPQFAHTFPAAIVKPSLIALVAWIAQTFLQLVLLSVIMVGQNIQSLASDARAEKTFEDTEKILDRLDTHTQGGLADIIARLDKLEAPSP